MNILLETKSFISKCVRVWKITKKPSKMEFKTVAKASAVGVLIIGLVGFLISLVTGFFIPK